MTGDTESLVCPQETPVPDAKPRSGRLPSTRSQQERRRVWFVVLGVSCVFVVVVVVCIWKYILSVPAPAAVGRAALIVSQDARTYPNSFRSIQLGLSRAEPGDRIVLADARHRENVVLSPQKGPTRVTFAAAEGKHVLWVAENPAEPMLVLSDARDFQLLGKGITLDGEGRVNTLIALSMHCSGLQLQEAILKGFKVAGITVTNCVGDTDRPVRLSGLQIAATIKGATSGIAFDANPSVLAYPVNENVVVSNTCRFEQFGGGNPIQVKSKANGVNVKIPTPIQ